MKHPEKGVKTQSHTASLTFKS